MYSTEILKNGKETYEEMIKCIKKAKQYVYLETYIFAQDTISKKFKDILIKKAKEGVKVSLIYDSIGSMFTRRKFFDEMKQHGINVICFNPIIFKIFRLRYIRGWHNRDHRKILVIDNKIGFIGGHNISDAYIDKIRDTHLKITGPEVIYLKDSFLESMRIAKNELYYKKSHFLPYLKKINKEQKGRIQIYRDCPSIKYNFIRDKYIELIDKSKRSIYLQTAFFIPDKPFFKSLINASLRGIDIKLILSFKTDIFIADLASKNLFKKIVDNGINLYLYNGFIHAKIGIFDEENTVIGSTNLDYRSFRHSYETTGVFIDKKLSKDMISIFNDDLKNSESFNLERWERRSILNKLMEKTAYLFREFL